MALVKADQTPSNPVKSPSLDVPREILRDHPTWKRPLIVTPEGTVESFDRASSLGGVLEDQTGLGTWRMRQVAWGVGHSQALRLRAQAVPTTSELDDKKTLGRIAWDAFNFADSNSAAQVGTAIHSLTEQHDSGRPLPDVDETVRPAMQAYVKLIQHFTVHAMEQFVVCPELRTAGTYDRLLSPRQILTAPDGTRITPEDRLIDDLKTSSTSDYFGLKFAIQESIYGNGRPYRGWIDRDELERLGYDRDMSTDDLQRLPLKVKKAITRGEYLDWPDGIAPRTDWGLIMHLPSGGSSVELFWVDLRTGRELAQLAKTVQRWRSSKDLVVRAELPTPQLSPALANGGLMSLIDAVDPPTKQAFNDLWAQHKSAWTSAHTARAGERLEAAASERVAS